MFNRGPLSAQKYMKGVFGVLGGAVRTLKGEVPFRFRIITKEPPFFVLAQTNVEAEIGEAMRILQAKLQVEGFDLRWYCESEIVFSELPSFQETEMSMIHRIKGVADNASDIEALFKYYNRIRALPNGTVILSQVGAYIRERLAVMFQRLVDETTSIPTLESLHHRLSGFLNGADERERMWFPVLLDTLQRRVAALQREQQGDETTSSSSSISTSIPLPSTSSIMADAVGHLKEHSHCVICLDPPPQICIDPCGHFCMCQGCASKVEQCPLCRRQIVKRIYVFHP